MNLHHMHVTHAQMTGLSTSDGGINFVNLICSGSGKYAGGE